MNPAKRVFKKIIEAISGYEISRFGSSFFLLGEDAHTEAFERALLEMELRSILKKYQVNVVLDVGANQGQFASLLRNSVRYEGRIISFEPVSSIFSKLKMAAVNDPLWDIHNIALGSENTIQKIKISERSEFSSFLNTNEYCRQHFGEHSAGTREELISVRRLDTLLEELIGDLGTARIFLKMDTQGYDIEVFKGLGDKCKHIVALQSEISVLPIYLEMPPWTESVSFFENAGFGIAGLFPVSRDSSRIIEFDCIMVGGAAAQSLPTLK